MGDFLKLLHKNVYIYLLKTSFFVIIGILGFVKFKSSSKLSNGTEAYDGKKVILCSGIM